MLDYGLLRPSQSVIAQLDQVLDRATPLTLFRCASPSTCRSATAWRSAPSMFGSAMRRWSTRCSGWIWKVRRPTASSPTSRASVAREMRLDPSGVGRRRWSASLRRSGSSTRLIYDDEQDPFSSDMFTHVWSDKIEGPWLMEATTASPSNAFVRSFLLGTGFWWLEGARSDPFARACAECLRPTTSK